MTALLHSAPLTSLRDFAAPLQEQPFRICRKQLHRRPVTAHRAAASCHYVKKQAKRDVKAYARVVAENPTAPEVKDGQEVRTLVFKCHSDAIRVILNMTSICLVVAGRVVHSTGLS